MQSKGLHLVGGRPQFDLTILDFVRWGMGDATMRLRDTAHDGMNIMHKLHERSDWIEPFPGREHHKGWLQNVVHPDARLMAAAPRLLDTVTAALSMCDRICEQYGSVQFGIDFAALSNGLREVILEATGASS